MRFCPKLTEIQLQELYTFIKDKDSQALEVKRAQAVTLLNKGIDIETITKTTGYKRRQIYELRKIYLKIGIDGIRTKRKGRPKELLTRKQIIEIKKILKEKDAPLRLGYGSKFFTTAILAHYTERTYKVRYKSKTSYYLIFKRVKFTYHKPGRVYEKHDKDKVVKWRKEVKPVIKRVWSRKDTVILTEDEMNLSSLTTFQKVWLPEGEYPRVEVSNTKKSKSIYGFLNVKEGIEHAFVASWQNMHITKEMLIKIRKLYPTQKILLLWDGPGWHKGSVVANFIKQDGNIKIIYFPSYSPEENPQEHIWNSDREHVTHNNFIPNVEKTADDFVEYLNKTKFPYKLLGFSAKS